MANVQEVAHALSIGIKIDDLGWPSLKCCML